MYIKVTIIQLIHSLNKYLLSVAIQLRFTHSPHPLLPQQQSVCNLSFPPNQFVFRCHRWNFSTRMFVFPQRQVPRWWIHSLAPKSTSPGSFPRLGPSQSLSPDQEELCRLSVPWKWWCGYILSLKPQEIMNAKKNLWVYTTSHLCALLFTSISSEEIIDSPECLLSWGLTKA